VTMRPAASTRTNTRSGAIETGPRTSGAVGNGWGIDFATPPQIRSSPFCIAIHTPIITSIVVSIDSARSGRKSTSSHRAPSAVPHAIAASTATKK